MPTAEEEARRLMIEKRFGGNAAGASTGGTGSARRKPKGNPKSVGDDKKLGGVLKKMQMQNLPSIEEVNIFKDDGNVIHITNPKVQSSPPCNTYVVSGNVETKQLVELLPGILTQLGPEHTERLRKYAEQIQAQESGKLGTVEEGDDDDDDVPELVENFEEAAK